MKLSKKNKTNGPNMIKVRINAIKGDMIECSHVASNFKVKSFFKPEMELDVGQIVLLEYSSFNGIAGYIVVDDLSEIIDAIVLEAQHIISDNKMYTSLVLENPSTGKRVQSLINNESEIFKHTSTIVKGDRVKMKMNNGEVFNIQMVEE